MTDETQKLFSAPWTARECPHVFAVNDASGELKAETLSAVGANRLARLSELYDALMEAAAGKCWSCAGENTETMLDHPCPKGHDEDCYVAKWRELLRKVRGGE